MTTGLNLLVERIAFPRNLEASTFSATAITRHLQKESTRPRYALGFT
jgi:hypothetical protein